MAEAAIAIAYPEPWNKGKALGYWLTYRLAGQILGGAINLGLNKDRDQAGKVTYTVYQIFIALQCLGPAVGLFLTRPHKVQRRDGKKVELAILERPWYEINQMTKLFFTKKFLFILLWIGQAVFAEAVFFTYLACKFYTDTGYGPTAILTSGQCGFRFGPVHLVPSFQASLRLSVAIYSVHFSTIPTFRYASELALRSGVWLPFKALGGSGLLSL
jgi:hypothetical protein